MSTEAARTRWPVWALLLLLVAAASLLGLLFAARTYVMYAYYPERSVTFGEAALPSLTDVYLWALLVPLMIWAARRFPIDREGWAKAVGAHLAMGTLIAALKFFLEAGAAEVLPWMPSRSLAVPRFIFEFYPNLFTYAVIVAIAHAVDYARKYRDRELRASQLEARLAQVQLQVLRMQLQPHFLFNTLNAISTLIHKDAEAADQMLVRLADLLRLTIDKIGVHEVPLKEELEFLRSYLEIERTRFQDRLSVAMKIDPEVLDALVPNLILQPLVENSIRHGLAPRSEPGRIEVSASRVNGHLRLTVADDGPGLVGAGAGGDGMGLANVQERLTQLYGAAYELDLRNRPEGGLVVSISIPLRAREPESENTEARELAKERDS